MILCRGKEANVFNCTRYIELFTKGCRIDFFDWIDFVFFFKIQYEGLNFPLSSTLKSVFTEFYSTDEEDLFIPCEDPDNLFLAAPVAVTCVGMGVRMT